MLKLSTHSGRKNDGSGKRLEKVKSFRLHVAEMASLT